ncbi:pneumococcal serine-rich repeat protein-like [Anopheles funestus]|uniref:pneumococcal serine-rich repeat protein-like n=1 Tax=Anopheles funestus TaxID=62324 RepID=UPI0020C61C07|nr:pneumococcal serine-rich repeat protein-like [Anopheles funestus]XP_049284987.1 pneumococcal serine-rich repeat protein-like [Anopheles funestus]XP_049284988.1 pneumococcal serine-rich repeat protein-like [Anopheles funestus]XP_049284989.1 pneumococcal serine-rich repeat protein-like [Anopheles funestus]XP_049284990.1 pneumococcal serine-rich repeat protein-like [Anopheles funestus]XP_049284992.1 pneumococcal serine-rich repeat protein-like [Anopheles funestus]
MNQRAIALCLTLLALGVTAGPTPDQAATGKDVEALLTTVSSGLSSEEPTEMALVETVSSFTQPAVEDSQTEVSSSSSSSSATLLSSPASVNVPVDEPAQSMASSSTPSKVPSASFPSPTPSEAPLMASSTIVSSGQTPTGEGSLSVSATGTLSPETMATTEVLTDAPKPLESITSTVSDGTPESDGDDKKASDLEPESETPVISFGIRLFTVEVATGTERASDDQTDLSNATQAQENVTNKNPASNEDGADLVDTTVSSASLSTSAVSTDGSRKVNGPENVDGSAISTTTNGQSTVTINTQVMSNGAAGGAYEFPEDAQEDAFSNEIHVERNLKNGLYRIKIAEITTDEFDNGLRENDNENMLMTDTMGSQGNRQLPLHKSVYPSKINIDDFYPSKLEDFKTEQAHQQLGAEMEKRLREKSILRNEDGERLFESTIMKPSDVLPVLTTTERDEKAGQFQEQLLGDGMERPSNVGTVTSASSSSSSSIGPVNNATGQDGSDISTTKIEIELIDDTSETSASDERSSKPTIDNITEKLEENDEVISRIEENFKGFRAFEGTAGGDDEEEYRDAMDGRKDDEVITIAISSVTFSSSQQDSAQTSPPPSSSVPSSTVAGTEQQPNDEEIGVPVSGSDIVKNGYGNLFIPRRVKKNDPSTATKLAQLGKNAPLKKIDFAATKFNTDNNGPGGVSDSADGSKKDKPEFSTTKFYNSKELYSELHHQALVPNRTQTVAKSKATAAILSEKDIITAKTMSKPAQAILAASSRKSSRAQPATSAGADVTGAKGDIKQHTLKTNFVLNEETVPIGAKVSKSSTASVTEDSQQRKIKSLGSAASAIIAATAKLAKPNRASATSTTTTTVAVVASAAAATTTSHTVTATATSSPVLTSEAGSNDANRVSVTSAASSRIDELVQASTSAATNERLMSKPSAALSRLHEKINTLDCEIQSIAPDSSVWRGNETHELQLPAMTPEDCSAGSSCTPTTISWEGTADIQSGDVLIVEIDDHHLIPSNYNKSTEGAHHTTTAVYQVTRLGHENCDITEGVLLDITPLVADGKKLVTLYDKDLTEGINLLIVVSEQWGQQCVRLKVTVKSDNCGENADCSGKGVCYSNNSMEGYECQCCSGFAGTHCEEIDACSPSPCTNNGICVDLSQGHEGNAYQCLCPYGYTGKNCQFESDPCNPSQCLNGGTCVGNSTHFRCDCTSGYTGPLCQHNLNECESSPCVHGICVDQEDGFRCFCQPGFSGELCNFEYNECESNPCINGGQCIDNIGGFSCKCTRGYTGKRCHIKVDFCANDPCPDGHRCIDHGDDFTCECPGGRNGPDCNQVPRTLCNVNPCANGGTCWTTEESFYCACRPGFTGKMCEENFVIDTMVSSSEMLSDTLANQNGLRAISGSTMYGDDGVVAHTGKHNSAIELHNAYIAAGTLATAILIVAIVVTACHCKVHQSYRHFASKHRQLIPVFGRRAKPASNNRHWLSGKGHQQQPHHHQSHTNPNYNYAHQLPNSYAGLQPERIINKPLPMNLENDMYYTVDFGDSQNAPLIQ